MCAQTSQAVGKIIRMYFIKYYKIYRRHRQLRNTPPPPPQIKGKT